MTLFSHVKHIDGYTSNQILIFFLSFNVVDTITQLFFREVYRFREVIVSGNFDLVLVKPMSPLFRALAGGADILDVFMAVPYVVLLIYFIIHTPYSNPLGIFLYIILIGNAFIIATAFHIMILALAILTTDIDHTIMIYRDLSGMGRLPVDIYIQPIQGILMYLLPIGIMMTVPTKIMFGLLHPVWVCISFAIAWIFLAGSHNIWNHAVRYYNSASS